MNLFDLSWGFWIAWTLLVVIFCGKAAWRDARRYYSKHPEELEAWRNYLKARGELDD